LTGRRQAGALGKVKVVAYDAAAGKVVARNNGAIQALIAQDPKQEGEVAMESAAKLIKGDKLDKTTLTEIVTIKAGDNATADKYEYKGDCD
jgi:ribose transport system substrate-binding protein